MLWEFRFLLFSDARLARGEEAARMLYVEEGDETVLWMSIEDIERCIQDYGSHPELVKALMAYGVQGERAGNDTSPARLLQVAGYPFGDRIPKRLRMRRTVLADMLPYVAFSLMEYTLPPMAFISMEFAAWTQVDGSVSAQFPDGRRLPLQPGDYEVIEWEQLPGTADAA